MSDDRTHAIVWEAPEHRHFHKPSDWYWALGIIALCGAVAAFFFGNFMFAVLILVGAAVMALQSAKPPRIVPFMVGTRGVRAGNQLFTYGSLEAYHIDEEDALGTQLLLRSKRLYMPLIVIPIPDEYIHEIEDLLRERLKEEDLEEPLAHKLLEMVGF
ncbi:hypothetical protein A2392_02395 [Candidatus Kaiserbacteria bacterium RIFOXYB1_FULL_46_14]|uniref:DUF5673 domain-containing protein n=1 Tax=Candidatus Kaiserbacteria bacterium RIFOXYB1_FULL_46_14 TaxID=1798531 RepID=A0A1F6FIB4_9BACT|nr:MAG: hypothetical protein A2392_02395 [Candidatus Kaiserbacteria bacterium RIFOXYB1_FULL_46_14]